MKKIILFSLAFILLGSGCASAPTPIAPQAAATSVSTTEENMNVVATTSLPATVQPPPTATTMVKVFYISLGTGSATNTIGCGDSAVSLQFFLPSTTTPLTAALHLLLNNHAHILQPSGLYNALYQSNLHIASVVISNGIATVKLAGTMALGGECDDPRFLAQLQKTAEQFSTVKEARIFVNDKPLQQLLSGK